MSARQHWTGRVLRWSPGCYTDADTPGEDEADTADGQRSTREEFRHDPTDHVTNFFDLAGAMVPAGMRRLVADLIRDGHVGALVTTGATLILSAITS